MPCRFPILPVGSAWLAVPLLDRGSRLLGGQRRSLKGDDSCLGCCLAPLRIRDDLANIEIELRGKLLSDGANLVNNRIAEHGYSSISSSGVQIGGVPGTLEKQSIAGSASILDRGAEGDTAMVAR